MQKRMLVAQSSRAVSLLLLPMLSSVARKVSSFSWTPTCCGVSLRNGRNTLITRRSAESELMGNGGTSVGLKFTKGQQVARRVAFSADASAGNTGGENDPPCNVSTEGINSPFLQTLLNRGFFYQCTDLSGLDNKLCGNEGGIVSAYLGFDATADSLHVGSLLQIMMLRHLQKCGHRPVILVGGGTTKIGDPSGRDESRQLLNDSVIRQNIAGISSVFRRFLDFNDGPTAAILVNNTDWLNNLGYIDFLREYGSQFTVNRMLNFESVKMRLGREQPLTFLEFNYMLLQAYDFVELYRCKGVCLQLGGSDQWGNMVCGVDLGRRWFPQAHSLTHYVLLTANSLKLYLLLLLNIPICFFMTPRLESAQLFALTAPLITMADGKKMGKSAEGALWLNEDRQFWRNTADTDVGRFLRLFTEVPLTEVERLEKLKGKDINDAKLIRYYYGFFSFIPSSLNPNPPKIILADEATKMLHGEKCLDSIRNTAASLFAGSDDVAVESLPRFRITENDISSGRGSVLELYVFAGLAKSKNEVRRLIKGGGARINDVKVDRLNMLMTNKNPRHLILPVITAKQSFSLNKVEDEGFILDVEDFKASDGELKLSSGKKKYAIVELLSSPASSANS